MAYAVPRAEWSEAEEYRQRLFYWEYLRNRWLAPGPAVLAEREHDEAAYVSPAAESSEEVAWLEPDTPSEQ